MSSTTKKPRGKPRGPGRPFQKGKSGNPSGRPRGVPNKVTLEVRDLARKLVEDETYQEILKKRLTAGKLAPAMETTLWYYAYGKPKETIDLGENAAETLQTFADLVRKAKK